MEPLQQLTREEIERLNRESADRLFDNIFGAVKGVIYEYVSSMETQLRTEKALRHISENNYEATMILCRRALEAGTLDKDTWQSISLIRSLGITDDYMPEGYVTLAEEEAEEEVNNE